MKKIILVVLLLAILAGCYFFYNKFLNKNTTQENLAANSQEVSDESENYDDPSKGTIVDVKDLSNKRILIEKHFLNYAFSFDHKGTIICTDGTMYNFAYSDQTELPTRPFENIQEASDDVIAHVLTFEGRIPKEDIERLKGLLETIDADYDSDNVAMDKGEDTIIYYNYDKDEIITLKSDGDSIVTNKSKNTNKILTILEDYHIRLGE